jgi:hypothetical protein
MKNGYEIGDVYYYVAIGHYNRLKVYSIKIRSAQDYGKGMAQFDTQEEAEKWLKEKQVSQGH